MNTLPHLTQLVERHLTDAQFFNLLDAPESADASLRAHVGSCAACCAELAMVSASLTNFRDAATSLAHAEMSRQRVFVPTPQPRYHRLVWSASLTLAAIVFAASVSFVRPGIHVDAPIRVATQTASSNVSDDALLDNIQQDLATSIPPSLEPLAVPAASGAANASN